VLCKIVKAKQKICNAKNTPLSLHSLSIGREGGVRELRHSSCCHTWRKMSRWERIKVRDI